MTKPVTVEVWMEFGNTAVDETSLSHGTGPEEDYFLLDSQ